MLKNKEVACGPIRETVSHREVARKSSCFAFAFSFTYPYPFRLLEAEGRRLGAVSFRCVLLGLKKVERPPYHPG